MQETTHSIQELAQEAASWFEGATRSDDSSYRRVKDGAPEWVTDLVREAHDTEMLPDDWRYDKIEDALNYIAEADDPEDSAEFADSAVDVYTNDRLEWLASHGLRAGYVDDARDNLGATGNIVDDIGLGQYQEAGEIYGRTLQALEAISEA